uniref:PTB domain-containing protein n=1 Tax=Mola mola TaxID=94237 RepID=A0A3Q3XCP6_MOLML
MSAATQSPCSPRIGYPTMFEGSSQTSDLSRPSAKSIYCKLTRTEWRYLDGRELRSLADCVERLKSLEELDRVWGQSMLLEVHGPKLLLKDIETKTELESVALSDIAELKAVLDSGTFHSLLTISVQTSRKRTTIFMFQCEDVRVRTSTRAQLSKEKRQQPACSFFVIHRPTLSREISHGFYCPFKRGTCTSGEKGVQMICLLAPFLLQDILNHILSDMEIFMVQVGAALDKKGKKKKMKRKQKKGKGDPSRK